MIVIQNLRKHYPGTATPQLDGASLSVKPGESISIRGASGCGKSTLLSLLAGFDSPDAGSIQINNVRLPFVSASQADSFRREHLGFVYQNFNLLDCLSVFDNIAFTARLKGNLDTQYQQQLMQALGIEKLAAQPIAHLSGGEQQRVAIARALNHRPSLLLADEPTGNLDEKTSMKVARLLFDLCKQTGTTVIVVTHASEVAEMANKPYLLHEGKVLPQTTGT
ncbi:ABC transporter ATP-binding protein [Alteromonas sp. CYL-A6]|uniref:ABC transporter ATP-binding protein n=1 Tax=Alteromonas nitratireducens TaxID=3390813 RepID=UPI0034AAA259